VYENVKIKMLIVDKPAYKERVGRKMENNSFGVLVPVRQGLQRLEVPRHRACSADALQGSWWR
jgi:hypothetical protein